MSVQTRIAEKSVWKEIPFENRKSGTLHRDEDLALMRFNSGLIRLLDFPLYFIYS